MSDPDRAATEDIDRQSVGISPQYLTVLLLVSATVFFTGVFVSELGGELGSDIDFKPFFLVYLLVAITGFGGATLSLGLGAAIGEGAHDLAEGYESDEPLGFVGYVAGFVVFGWVLHRVAPDPTHRGWQGLAAVAGAFVQALFEAFAFLFKRDFGPAEALVSLGGNTVTHGVFLGAIPLVVLYPVVADYADRYGLAPSRGESGQR